MSEAPIRGVRKRDLVLVDVQDFCVPLDGTEKDLWRKAEAVRDRMRLTHGRGNYQVQVTKTGKGKRRMVSYARGA